MQTVVINMARLSHVSHIRLCFYFIKLQKRKLYMQTVVINTGVTRVTYTVRLYFTKLQKRKWHMQVFISNTTVTRVTYTVRHLLYQAAET